MRRETSGTVDGHISLVVSEDGFVVCCVCAMARVQGLQRAFYHDLPSYQAPTPLDPADDLTL